MISWSRAFVNRPRISPSVPVDTATLSDEAFRPISPTSWPGGGPIRSRIRAFSKPLVSPASPSIGKGVAGASARIGVPLWPVQPARHQGARLSTWRWSRQDIATQRAGRLGWPRWARLEPRICGVTVLGKGITLSRRTDALHMPGSSRAEPRSYSCRGSLRYNPRFVFPLPEMVRA